MRIEISTGTIIRTSLLVLALVNQVLCVLGYSPLPIENDQLEQLLTTGFTIVIAIISWWKNNSFTKEAITADAYMHEMKGRR